MRRRQSGTPIELRDQLGIPISIQTLSRALRALQLTFKKKSFTPPSKIGRMSKRGASHGKPR